MMNTDMVTASQLTQIIGVIAAILALWWRVETRISRGAVEAMLHSTATARELTDFKLFVAEHYVKSAMLSEVERRILDRFDAVVEELHGMREDFHTAMLNARAQPQRRRKSS